MKIKFLPLKRNGQISKTPVYISELNQEFCAFKILNIDTETWRYNFSHKSLYETYKQITELKRDIGAGNFFVGNQQITQEKLISVIKQKVTEFENKINLAIQTHQSKAEQLKELHKNSFSDLNYVANQMQNTCEEYKQIIEKINLLKSSILKHCVDEQWNQYQYIIDDITPIKPEDLL